MQCAVLPTHSTCHSGCYRVLRDPMSILCFLFSSVGIECQYTPSLCRDSWMRLLQSVWRHHFWVCPIAIVWVDPVPQRRLLFSPVYLSIWFHCDSSFSPVYLSIWFHYDSSFSTVYLIIWFHYDSSSVRYTSAYGVTMTPQSGIPQHMVSLWRLIQSYIPQNMASLWFLLSPVYLSIWCHCGSSSVRYTSAYGFAVTPHSVRYTSVYGFTMTPPQSGIPQYMASLWVLLSPVYFIIWLHYDSSSVRYTSAYGVTMAPPQSGIPQHMVSLWGLIQSGIPQHISSLWFLLSPVYECLITMAHHSGC
jgi:hypothetical protein